MTIKTKLSLGLGFLFLIIFALAAYCSNHVGKLAKETDNILKDNYNSLGYSRNMISALEDMKNSISSAVFNSSDTGMKSDYYQQLFESGKVIFETNLKSENNNITEIHEKETVEKLNNDYDLYLKLCLQMKSGIGGSSVYFNDFLPACEKLRQSINGIYDINMQAVVRKSQLVKQDSAGFFNSMAVTASLCVLLALGYFWYFPLYISTSFGYLAKRIQSLLKNLGVAFDINTRDEAFVILQAIKLLENKLGVKNEETGGL
jgi:hypothetical protein